MFSFDVESREYNGKWYTDVKAWKVVGACQTKRYCKIIGCTCIRLIGRTKYYGYPAV